MRTTAQRLLGKILKLDHLHKLAVALLPFLKDVTKLILNHLMDEQLRLMLLVRYTEHFLSVMRKMAIIPGKALSHTFI